MDTDQRTDTLLVQDSRLFVVCADGLLEILRLQPEGKKAMTAGAFLRGNTAVDGKRLERRK